MQVLNWIPHCHGTHTECVGHILPNAVFVLDTIDTEPCLAKLISLHFSPERPRIKLQDLLHALPQGLEDCSALVIRTLPNTDLKKSRNYSLEPGYTVLDTECMRFLADSHLRHLLIDAPSLDAADNEQLSNHRIWWGLDPDADHKSQKAYNRSITEMIFVPEHLIDGDYWLQLELSPLESDATPSRPVLYPVQSIKNV